MTDTPVEVEDLKQLLSEARYYVASYSPAHADDEQICTELLARIDAAVPPPPAIEICDDPLCCQVKGHEGAHDDIPF